MNANEIMKLHAEKTIDISNIDDDSYFGDGWVVLHLNEYNYIKGLHYIADDEDDFNHLNYIAEFDIKEDESIYHGFIEEYKFFVTEVIKENKLKNDFSTCCMVIFFHNT